MLNALKKDCKTSMDYGRRLEGSSRPGAKHGERGRGEAHDNHLSKGTSIALPHIYPGEVLKALI